MILTCPACGTRYNAPGVDFGNRSRKVRCKKCAHEWVIAPPEPVGAMSLGPQPAAGAQGQAEVLVEEPEVEAVPEAPALSVAAEPVFEAQAKVTAPRGRPIRPRRRSAADHLMSLGLAVIVMAGILLAAWYYRNSIVHVWPAAAGAYAALGVPVNVLGIEIRNQRYEIAPQNGIAVLTVVGEITNTTSHELTVPPLELKLRDDRERELYHWSATLTTKRLGPGETAPFRTTLVSPPLEAHDVQLRFKTGA